MLAYEHVHFIYCLVFLIYLMYLNLNIWVYVDACILTHEYVGSMYVHVFKNETQCHGSICDSRVRVSCYICIKRCILHTHMCKYAYICKKNKCI